MKMQQFAAQGFAWGQDGDGEFAFMRTCGSEVAEVWTPSREELEALRHSIDKHLLGIVIPTNGHTKNLRLLGGEGT